MHSTIERRLHRQLHQGRSSKDNGPAHDVARILFVDDDPDIQTALEMRMRPYAVEVEHAFFGTQGIVEAINRKPSVILTDLAMPNGNGEYLIETLKRNRSTAGIPVVVFTGMRDPTLRNRVMRLGAEGFLSKPAPFDELLREIGRFVDIHRLRSKGPQQ